MSENLTLENRPREELPCGCVHFPSFTEGKWVNNFGEGPEVWMAGTHYQSWTDTSMCREGHDYDF